MNKNLYMDRLGINAKIASEEISKLSIKKRNLVLSDFCKYLKVYSKKILAANKKDLFKLKKIKSSMANRLIMDIKKINQIRMSIKEIIKFPDPLSRNLKSWRRPNGIIIKKKTIPIGVIGVIYESRPNVTADVAALCLKSGNCSILRGGSESYNSNKLLANLFRESLSKNNIDKNCVQFIEKKERKVVDLLLSKMSNYIDVIVPRGGKGLVAKVQNFSKIHVIGHLEGICHIYVDKSSNVNMAKKIIINAKMRRTSICGAVETLLIDEKALNSHGKIIVQSLISSGCEVRVDNKINKLFKNKLKNAKQIDWKTEYLDKKVSIKTVKNVQDAVNHILKYGTMHTDSIITNNSRNAKIFLEGVNSSIAMHNVSTQFADGGEFGFGGEIGISTNKLPPRGPVGIDQLTSYKYIVSGNGIVRP